ncbi:ubiquitin carboxyl-terminal hydrolase 5-like isoform X1 [Montipora capricornis]|uniref:ubiquitin carboxyl-terminal hydrolase 5-like isoform X1 n=2 Tax=Montipora capricornis TaxID=246305 RepID=UPI0035F14B65
MEFLKSSSIRVPQGGDKVYKEECVYCFNSPESDKGLYICLATFLGFCEEHIYLHMSKTSHRVFLHLKKVKKPPSETDDTTEFPPKKKPTRLAIGVEGGFDVDQTKVEYDEFSSLTVFGTDGDPLVIPLPNADIPLQVQLSIAGVLTADAAAYKDQVASWDGEKRAVSKHASNLLQLDNGVKVPPRGWKCTKCDMKENLWLNLTDGTILCGRRYFDGSGGNNHAIDYYKETNYPLAVKLGTITPDGADVFSYDEDDMVEDPNLAQHLAHFGINITQMEKTDKTMAELEIDINMRIREWDVIQEAGKKLTPVCGPGYTGLKNLGNSCYMNSVMQVLFSLPEFKQRYGDRCASIFSKAPANPTGDFNAQMAKFADGVLSGKYSPSPDKEPEEITEPQGDLDQDGIAPQMFKSVIGRGHPEFSSNRQQDAQEFFMHLLSTMDRVERTATGVPNPVDSFRFKVEERTQCMQSGKVRYNSREDTLLSLCIPMEAVLNKDEVAVYEQKQKEAEAKKEKLDPSEVVRPRVAMAACLEAFGAPEVVDDFYSTALQTKSVAQTSTRFATFPDYLMVQMKKFTLGDDWVPKKLDVSIDILEEIDLTHLRATGLQSNEEQLPEAEQAAVAEIQIDDSVVMQLVSMGFDKEGCRKAVYHTNNQGIEPAMNWVLEHMGDPDFSTPLNIQASGAAGSAAADEGAIDMIIAMGFTRPQAIKALQATDNNLERAVDWIFSHAQDLDSMEVENQGSQETGPQYKDGHGKYRLIAFISHMGTSTMCGHYVCHVLKEGRWVIFNDRKVALSETPPKEHGYLYLYRRVDS